MESKLNHYQVSFRFALALAAVFLSGVLALLRFLSNFSFSQPLHLITSGSEEQSLFSLWKFIHGQPVYTDPTKIPFTSSYLNWLFYAGYGTALKGILAVTRLSEAWIPTLARLLSVCFALLGVWICQKVLKEIFPNADKKTKQLFALISFYLFFGPLAAFWPFTARPDMAANFFELLAFYFFIKYFQTQPWRAALLATLSAFAAWSFKQVNIAVFGSLILFCLFYQPWAAALMAFLMLGLCAIVIEIGGAGYWRSAVLSHFNYGFSPLLAAKIFLLSLAESALMIPGYAALAAVKIKVNKINQLCFITAILTTLYGLFTSLKIGASENYFIPASLYVTFVCLIYLFNEPKPSKFFQASFYFSLAVNILFILFILFGIKGRVSKRYEHQQALALLHCAQSLPRPIFSQTTYLNLPWMLGGESFVLSDGYWLEKKAHQEAYERGGIEGLIKEGYFKALLLERAKLGRITEVSHYVERPSSCPETHLVFVKRRL